MSLHFSKTANLNKIQEVISEGNQPLYGLFNREVVGEILSSDVLEGVSKRSLRIRIKPKAEDRGEDLAGIFGLDAEVFGKKYLEAISGDGQEARRIRTLHSSSLLCLQCFYGVSEDRPLVIKYDGRIVKFTSSSFEVKLPVEKEENGESRPANIDVVLVGNDEQTGKPVMLFLESKFSEYLSWGKYKGISNRVYEKTYSQLCKGGYLDRMGLKFYEDSENPSYSVLSSIEGRTLHYAGGIKQMVSHYLGVKNIAEREQYKGVDIYLGEILYKFPDMIDKNNLKFKDYSHLYEILAEGLNEVPQSKFKVVEQCFTYQDVFKLFNLEPSVRLFYSLSPYVKDSLALSDFAHP